MDSAPEDDFDDLVRLAAEFCGAPIALVSLLDADRQWFKARYGVSVTETPRNVSFCNQAIKESSLMIVPDAAVDERFASTVVFPDGPPIRFYAGAPLMTPEGTALGTLCVMGYEARELDERGQRALHVLGNQVMSQLELRRKNAELAGRERLLFTLLETEPESILLLGRNGIIRMTNPAGLHLLGVEELGEVVHRSLGEFTAASDRPDLERLLDSVLAGQSGTITLQLVGATGAIRWVSLHGAPLRNGQGEVLEIVGIARDVSERQYSREERDKLMLMIQHLPEFVAINDLSGNHVFMNEGGRRMVGLGVSDPVDSLQSTAYVPEHLLEFFNGTILPTALETGYWEGEMQLCRLDTRELIDVHRTMFVIRDTQGNPAYLGTILRDISARVRAVQQSRVNEARYRSLFQYAPDGIIIADSTGVYLDVNDSLCDMLGYWREELIGKDASAIVVESERVNIQPAIDTINAHSNYQRGWQFRRKDGTVIDTEVMATTTPEGNILAMVRDISERKKLEQQYFRAQRMESIGTLAGGIAHDLNNVLGPIIMAVDLLRLKHNDADSVEMLELVKTAAIRGADMVRQVLSFARGVEGRRMEVQIRHLVRDIEKIIIETLPKNIDVRVSFGPDLWTLNGDPTQLHQVLMNLCVNARDAMPHGGRLTISAENHPVDSQYAAMNSEATVGPYILLQVEDNGTGMSAGVIDKAFDPFFTTKEVGKGTGLGLSTSLAIVQSHGGFIRIYSEVGKGTSFKVYLPAQNESAQSPAPVVAEIMPRGHGELVLVVDDEMSIRQVTQQTLEAFGYRVLTATDGADAIAKFAVQQSEIAVVVTDMMMPVLDGPATIQVIRKLRPDCPIIAVSGLAANGQATQAALLGVKHFLPKPYTAELLLGVLHSTLQKPA